MRTASTGRIAGRRQKLRPMRPVHWKLHLRRRVRCRGNGATGQEPHRFDTNTRDRTPGLLLASANRSLLHRYLVSFGDAMRPSCRTHFHGTGVEPPAHSMIASEQRYPSMGGGALHIRNRDEPILAQSPPTLLFSGQGPLIHGIPGFRH